MLYGYFKHARLIVIVFKFYLQLNFKVYVLYVCWYALIIRVSSTEASLKYFIWELLVLLFYYWEYVLWKRLVPTFCRR
jgi:hypothetical protein